MLAVLLAGCAPAPALEPLPLDEFLAALEASVPARRTADGVELVLDGEENAIVRLPGLRVIELELDTDAPLNVIAGCYNGSASIRAGPPFRARDLGAGEARIAFDLAQCIEWQPDSLPALFLRGTANVRVRAVRIARAPEDPGDFRALYDRATRWAPESIGATTINFLTPPWWDSARRSGVPERVAAAAGVLGLGVLLVRLARRRRLRPAPALLAAALLATLAYDAWFARRLLPALALVPEPDTSVRIREHLHNASEVGALAALAREVLAPDDAVGVLGDPARITGPRLVCFLMAPRICVLVRSGEEEHVGLSGVHRARLGELDALVVTETDAALPAGFEVVARVNERSYVARRR